jgi:hypothetical protein
MAKSLKIRDKRVLHIVDSYVMNNYDWRLYWQDLGEILQELRAKQ